MSSANGIHHVSAIAGDAQRNVDFYAGVLGLRLVKKRVNFDDPSAYHLYYGDEQGSPGSLITFFPYPRSRKGRAGVGQVALTSLTVPPAAIGFWLHRFVTLGVNHDAASRRFGQTTLLFRDRDGLQLELVTADGATEARPWTSREYSRSVYFREPGGVLFELATDEPGFTVDEPLDRLGSGLMLPPQYEASRAEIESRLPELHDPLAAPLASSEADSRIEPVTNE